MQKGILLMLDEKFLAEIDAAFPRFGYSDRTTFIRDAVIQHLKQLGIEVPLSYKAGPPRIKTSPGRPKKQTSPPKQPAIKAVPGTGKKPTSTPSKKIAS